MHIIFYFFNLKYFTEKKKKSACIVCNEYFSSNKKIMYILSIFPWIYIKKRNSRVALAAINMVMSVQFQLSSSPSSSRLWLPNSPSPPISISPQFIPTRCSRFSTSPLAATPTLQSQYPTIQVTQNSFFTFLMFWISRVPSFLCNSCFQNSSYELVILYTQTHNLDKIENALSV